MPRTVVKTIVDEIEIIDFIFHVVHHGEEVPYLMDNTPLGRFEGFFKQRVAEVLAGNIFDFIESSDFLKKMQDIDNDSNQFVEISKQLASDFHSRGDERVKPGVMILIKSKIQDSEKYIVLKYNHDRAITYSSNGTEAMLEAIDNTLSRDKKAIQKSAVIDLNSTTPHARIIDHINRKDITKFFSSFLGVRRRYDRSELTIKLKKVLLKTIKKHKDSLSNEIASSISARFFELAKSSEVFDMQNFLGQILGEENISEAMQADFEKYLESEDILGEAFELDPENSKLREVKLQTAEGVSVKYDANTAGDTVQIDKTDSGLSRIVITTSSIHEE